MFDFLKNEHIVNTCVVILLIAILFMTFVNFNQINNTQQQENYCGCDKPVQQTIYNLKNVAADNTLKNIDNDNKNKLVLYYAMWCGYSRQFLPTWEQIKLEILNTSDINTVCEQYDCSQQQNNCDGIEGYPTIILIKPDGTKIPYNNARSLEAMMSFVNENK